MFRNYNILSDVLVIGAHPDDAEICIGGTIAKLTSSGKKVVIADCTKGELGTRGNVELRAMEASDASSILNISGRINLNMNDGDIRYSDKNIYKLVKLIRKVRPDVVLIPPEFERHPDHQNLYTLAREAMFKSGLVKFETEENGNPQEVFRTRKVYCYMQYNEFKEKPGFYIDISDFYDKKIKAVKAYKSQLFITGETNEIENETMISSKSFFEYLDARAKYFGGLIGVKYAEAYLNIEPIGLNGFEGLI